MIRTMSLWSRPMSIRSRPRMKCFPNCCAMPRAKFRIRRPTRDPSCLLAPRFHRSIRRFALLPSTMSTSRATGGGLAGRRDADPLGFRWPAVRGLTGLLLAACIGVAGIAWQSDAAKKMIAKWTTQIVLTLSLPLDKLGLSAQPATPAVQTAAANAAPAQPAPLARTAPEGVAPSAAALAPDSARLLQSMARDLASVGQEIGQLKASIEQLKASQQQISRDF